MKKTAYYFKNPSDQMKNLHMQDRVSSPLKSVQFESCSVHSGLGSPSASQSNVILFEPCNSINARQSTEKGFTGKWKTSSLLIISMVIRFVFQLKTRIDSTKLQMITYRIFQLIDDASSDYQVFNNTRTHKTQKKLASKLQLLTAKCWRQVTKILKTIDNSIPVLMTNSVVLIVFQFIMVLTLLINLFYVPINLSFINQSDNIEFQMIPHIIFTLWIGVCCNTSVYKDEIILIHRSQIIKEYLKNWIWYDLLIVIPYYFKPLLHNYSEFTFILKVIQLRRIMEQFEYNNNFKEIVAASLDLLKLIVFLLFITHCCACAWHFLGVYERETLSIEQNWLSYYQLTDTDWGERYIVSLYWSVVTTLTVGYGDITPQTTLERLYVVFVTITICGLLGYTVTSIGEIFKSINDKKMVYKQQMKAINKLVKQRGLNTQLQIKVRKYFQHLIVKEQEENRLGEQLMAKLTKSLQEEVLIDTYRKTLKQSVLLKHLKQGTIDKLCTKVNVTQYAPGNEVIKCQAQAESIVFLLIGQLSVQAPIVKSDIALKQLTPGFVIGEQEFAEHSVYDYSIISIGYSKVAYITRSDFLQVLSLDSEETEKICQLRDSCLFNPEHKNLVGRVCEICGWTHGYLKCPFTFVQFDKWKILKRYNQSYDNQRKYFNQRRSGKMHTRSQSGLIEYECLQFQYQNKIIDKQ